MYLRMGHSSMVIIRAAGSGDDKRQLPPLFYFWHTTITASPEALRIDVNYDTLLTLHPNTTQFSFFLNFPLGLNWLFPTNPRFVTVSIKIERPDLSQPPNPSPLNFIFSLDRRLDKLRYAHGTSRHKDTIMLCR